MTQKADWLEDFHQSRSQADECVCQLRRFSRAFYLTGNEVMSDKMSTLADTLSNAVEDMDAAVGKHIHQQFEQSQKAIGETLSVIAQSIRG